MSKSPEFVQIEPDEDVSSIKDRLSFLRGKSVLLIWPEEGTALTRKLDLVLVQREAMRRAIRLALVTHDTQVIKHASELNISTFETIGESERKRWQRGRTKVFANRFQRPKGSPEAEELVEVASRTRGGSIFRRTRVSIVLQIGAVVLLSVLLLGVGYIIIPSATVYITLAQEEISTSVQIIADPARQTREVDVENGLIPTVRLRLEVEDTASVPTSGQVARESVAATGVIVFVNRTNTAISIPAGTQVSTGTGDPVIFRTVTDAQISSGVGQDVEVSVEAMPTFTGTVGNVEANLVNTVIGPLEDSVSVINPTAIAGGESLSVGIVSESDRELLLALIRQQLQARAFVEMQPLLSPTQFLVDETIRIVEERDDSTQFSAEVGDAADSLSLTMRVVVEAIAVDEEFAQRIVFAYMSNQIERGRVIDSSTIVYERGQVSVDVFTQTISFEMFGRVQVNAQLDENLLRERLAGRTIEDALTYIVDEVDMAPESPPGVVISPSWFDRLPILPMRIAIEMENRE